jgi:hypothetical protein
VLADIILWVLFYFNAERQFTLWGSFIPKILILLAALLTIVGITMEIVGPGHPVNTPRYLGQIWVWAMGIVISIMAYLSWTTMYFDVIMAVVTLQSTGRKLLLFLRWAVVILVLGFLLPVMICLGLAYGFGKEASLLDHTLPEISQAGASTTVTLKILTIFALVAWFICLFWGTGLVCATLRMIKNGSSGNSENEKELFVSKTIYTLSATFCGWLAWVVEAIYTVVVNYKVGPFWSLYSLTPYQVRFCELWCLWCSHLFIFGVLVFLSLALKTHFSNGRSYWKSLTSSVQRATTSARPASKSRGKTGSSNSKNNSTTTSGKKDSVQ